MAWYLRKSVKIGPVRFNLSKSGIGTSIGVRGFRVGVRPNGKSYIHAGGYGLYYREELGNGSGNIPRNIQPQTVNVTSHPPGTVEYKTASSQELAPQTRKELLSKLNQSYNAARLDYICGVGSLLPSYVSFQVNQIAGLIVFILGVIASIYVARWESKRRTVVIDYDFEDGNDGHFKNVIDSFNSLASNSKVWSKVTSRRIAGSHESKLNAGAASLIDRTGAELGEGKPPWVETNIDVPVIKTRGQSLYMLPDGILVYDDKGVGFVEYSDIQVDAGTSRYIEDENPPSDARIVGQTWKHPNRDGGPDRRFKSNHQIPICSYGELKIQSKSGMNLYLMTSKEDAPKNFTNQFSSVCNLA